MDLLASLDQPRDRNRTRCKARSNALQPFAKLPIAKCYAQPPLDLAMNGHFQDLRYAFRQLRKNPGFTAVTVLTLALGIGVNAAMFAVIDAVLLRPFPFPKPNQIVQMSEASPE